MIKTEERFILSLQEVTLSFGVSRKAIAEMIDEGIVSVHNDAKEKPQFDAEALRRIRTVLRLQRDLGINLAGAGLALDLLTEIERLKTLLEGKP